MLAMVSRWWVAAVLSATAAGAQDLPAAWSTVTMPYYFAYAPSPEQTQPPPAGPYKFYFPGVLSAPVADQLGCDWNVTGVDAPPYWFYNGVEEQGPIYRAAPAVGTMYQSGTGSGAQFRGFEFAGAFLPGNFSDQSYLVGAVYYSGNPCFAGDLEYGISHDYIANTTSFYFSNYSNCPASGSLLCYAQETTTSAVEPQCSGAITLPSLAPNSHGGYTYLYRNWIIQAPASGHYIFRVQVADPFNQGVLWSCSADPLAGDNTFGTCLGTFPYNTCGSDFPAQQLYETYGEVVAGISRDNYPGPPTAIVAMTVNLVKVAK
jgi:hypothetical protein